MPPSVVHLSVHFSGHVQGVGFRQATLQVAKEYEVAGFVMNLTDGRVRLEVEGAAEVVRCLSRPECKLTTLKMALNPALDEEAKVALQSSAVGTQCTLEF